jgi:hypothetical protein
MPVCPSPGPEYRGVPSKNLNVGAVASPGTLRFTTINGRPTVARTLFLDFWDQQLPTAGIQLSHAFEHV